MSAVEYFKACEKLDWYFMFSDDYSVYERGLSAYNKLQKAGEGDPLKEKIFDAFYQHYDPNAHNPQPKEKDFF